MKITHVIMQREVIHDREFLMNSVIVYLDNKNVLVCSKFPYNRKYKVELLVWLNDKHKWVKTFEKNQYTELMWKYRKQLNRKKKKLRSKFKRANYNQLMKPGLERKSSKKLYVRANACQPKKIPSTVQWAAKHPFNGGGFSPK